MNGLKERASEHAFQNNCVTFVPFVIKTMYRIPRVNIIGR